MPRQATSPDQDNDSLHILPLSIMPLQTPALKKARLIKNSRLEGVVELFSGESIGSAQVYPKDLDQVFQFNDRNQKDLEVVQVLCPLPSYDVYSLRIELRQLGVAVDDHSSLQLSEDKQRSLAGYMREFTQPLISLVYGGADEGMESMSDIIGLIASPEKGQAKENLMKMSKALDVEITAIPAFLQNYGDVYLSLAYYQQCLDQNLPTLAELLASLSEIRNDRELKSRGELMRACTSIEKKSKGLVTDIKNILEVFKLRTADMWENVSSDSFSQVKDIITTYQASIGGALCGMTVKLGAWKKEFPKSGLGSKSRRANFIMSDLRHGMEGIKEINYVG